MSEHHITVAEAVAILNVAIVVVQITYPLLITLVAVGIVKRRTNAATWSVFGRLINQSYFPFLLQTDTVAGNKVDKRIRGIAISSALTTLLLAVAAIVTPLGLHSQLRVGNLSNVRFEYVKDISAMGRATQSREGYNSSRVCQSRSATVSCPGNDDGLRFNDNGTFAGLNPGREGASVTSWIPQNVTDVFTSAVSADRGTIANLFDIQYRSFVNYNNETKPNADESSQLVDFGNPRTQGRFQYYQQFLLDNRTRAIEGLIVSMQGTPGIGFRNHTLPPASEYGYSWSEQILFLEPQTKCTALNLTYEYIIPPVGRPPYALNQTLVDRGGFVDLPQSIPVLDLNNTQSDPRYLSRSHAAAVTTNSFLARYMNLTRQNFRLGTNYNISDFEDPDSPGGSGRSMAEPNRIYFSPFGKLNFETNAIDPSLPGPLEYLKSAPFYGQDDSLSSIARMVNGYSGADPSKITTIGAGGGLILGVGTQIDKEGNTVPSDTYQLTPGSKWSQPLFACVSGISASVKEVGFQLNGTATLDNLIVESVRPASYATDDDVPIWAMEKTGRNISQLAPYWGMVSQDAALRADVATVRQAEFCLPAGSTTGSTVVSNGLDSINDAIAGSKAPLAALVDIFEAGQFGGDGIAGAQDYTGGNNYLLYLQWQQLLSDSSSTGKVVDLIWTDLMANVLVGAKSPLRVSAGNNVHRHDSFSTADFASRPVSRRYPGISYDWRYAIPALLFICLYIGLLAWSLIMFMTRALSLTILKFMLNQTAAGRSITTERYQASSNVDFSTTAVWSRVRGAEVVRVGKDSTGPQDSGEASGQEYYPLASKSEAQRSAEQAQQ